MNPFSYDFDQDAPEEIARGMKYEPTVEYLYIGGTRHGEFLRTPGDQQAVTCPVPHAFGSFDLNTHTLHYDSTLKHESYQLRKIAKFDPRLGLEIRGKVMVLSPARATQLPAYVAEWAIEMILWKARLRTTKPEKYPV